MKRGARRLIVKLTLCTLAGAVITWGVAWGCALWARPTSAVCRVDFLPEADQEVAALLPTSIRDAWLAIPSSEDRITRKVEVQSGPGLREGAYVIRSRAKESERDEFGNSIPVNSRRWMGGFGTYCWPCVALTWVDAECNAIPKSVLNAPLGLKPLNRVSWWIIFDPAYEDFALPGFAPPWVADWTSFRPLPLRIIPLGFTLNTLLAAGVLLGMVEGLAFTRRQRRRRKGRCAWCAYNRGGLAKDAACPECGVV